jgi:hypothetical protein
MYVFFGLRPPQLLILLLGIVHIKTANGTTPPQRPPVDARYRLSLDATPRVRAGTIGRVTVAIHRDHQADEHTNR